MNSLIEFFTDPVLRGPTLGCMLMCLSAALIGVIVFLRKQSLLGESLSHASYPGVILGVLAAGMLSLHYEDNEAINAFIVILGAFTSACLGLWSIYFLERFKIRTDSALCFVLASFFGVGITLASHVQFSFTALYRQIQAYLYGQAATMNDTHILIYGILSLMVVGCVILFYKELQAIVFNTDYAQSLGISVSLVNAIIFILTVLAIVIGIRSVGVVLMSAMLIAPAAAARQYTNKLHIMFLLAAFFGVVSGFLGNVLSVRLSQMFSGAFPTGPMIVLVAATICLLSVMCAPKRGLLLRLGRIARFRYRCLCENILKAMWRNGTRSEMHLSDIGKSQEISPFYLRFLLWRLHRNGWVDKIAADSYVLTAEGVQWAAQIVRLHRLWEVYLADYLGVGSERVHRNAEEMEHILTPEIERQLTHLLKDPKVDPHDQTIPPSNKVL